jgi:hypothetical protein
VHPSEALLARVLVIYLFIKMTGELAISLTIKTYGIIIFPKEEKKLVL